MTKVNAIFSVFGDALDTTGMSESLKIEPTASWRKGDPLQSNKNVQRRDSCWQISSGYQPSFDIDEQLQNIYQIIFPKRIELREIMNQYSASAKFDVVIKIEDGQPPGMALNKDVLDLAHELGAVFDFDLYIE